jgi:opacity protein-like surface antigen
MKHALLFVMIISFAGSAIASRFSLPENYTGVATLSAGPVWEEGGQSQTFSLSPGVIKTYSAHKSTNTLANGELFLGVQRNLSELFQGQLGIAVAVTSRAKLSGDIWDDADPAFNNYTYSYKVNHTAIGLKGKLLMERGCWLPWISVSMGAAFNQAFSYNNTPIIFQALPNNNFSSENTTSFTYTLGVGVQRIIQRHWQAGVGYEFTDWGKSALGPASGQMLNSGLTLSHLYTNGLIFNITYLAGR